MTDADLLSLREMTLLAPAAFAERLGVPLDDYLLMEVGALAVPDAVADVAYETADTIIREQYGVSGDDNPALHG